MTLPTSSPSMPVLFVGHGSPLNAITDNPFRRAWAALGVALPRPRAILCVSAHWETRGVYVTATPTPETIHDFYGFPKALFDVHYAAPGSAALARRVAELLAPQRVRLDAGRGLDHGAWSVLMPMYPQAEIPVVQLSLDTTQSAAWHRALARRLMPLRDEGVLIVGSGNIVHNLPLYDFHDATPFDWAIRFTERVKQELVAQDLPALTNWGSQDTDAQLAVPTAEHYLPLLYTAALRREGDTLQFLTDVVQGSMGMTSVLWSAQPLALGQPT